MQNRLLKIWEKNKYVEEFLANYDDINRGVSIGGIAETIAFLNTIEHIKKQI